MILRSAQPTNQSGFTIIELMMVVACIGILSTVAVTHFQEYKEKVYDHQARMQIRNLIIAEEGHYVANQSYPGSTGKEDNIPTSMAYLADVAEVPGISYGFSNSAEIGGGAQDGFILAACHPKSKKVFWFSSNTIPASLPLVGPRGVIFGKSATCPTSEMGGYVKSGGAG
ncbi:prepilin-type N-terminal cleavage/methylation domain-containing protein [bacterium]|nr:prepilin-type N-terminal cleavage/methylation domain-containing protein [bacterium]